MLWTPNKHVCQDMIIDVFTQLKRWFVNFGKGKRSYGLELGMVFRRSGFLIIMNIDRFHCHVIYRKPLSAKSQEIVML